MTTLLLFDQITSTDVYFKRNAPNQRKKETILFIKTPKNNISNINLEF